MLSSSVRLPAITFILLQLNKKGTGNQDSTLLGGDLPVMVRKIVVVFLIFCSFQDVWIAMVDKLTI